MPETLFRPGETCWRTAQASRLAVVIDAADYFKALRQAAIKARQAIYLIGWDFDLRIDMMPGESDADGLAPDGYPNRLGDFLIELTRRQPELDLYMLKWDGAMLAAIGKQVMPTLWMQWMSGDRVHFQLDSHHPVGACHHSKIVVIDDAVAFCGGIDATEDRWDTRDHTPDDERRVLPDGEPFDPWHDATTVLEGEAARALGDLARMRWKAGAGEDLSTVTGGGDPWPDDVEADLEDVEVAIARTAPRYHGEPLVNEIEHLYLAIIERAKTHLYLESQYLAGGSICDALERRLKEPDGPEIVVINPRNAESFMEDEAMHSVRALMMERLQAADPGGRFRIYHPVNAAGTPIYVHAKIVVADDEVLRIGSSNIDNRSMGYDTECDVAFQARNAAERKFVRGLRDDLVAEHLGCKATEFARALKAKGSLVAAIESLNEGRLADEDGAEEGRRGLVAIEAEPLDPLERALAETRLFDPRYRERAGAKAHAKHAVKRSLEPYQIAGGIAGMGLGALIAAGLGAWGGYTLYKRLSRPRRRKLAAPAVITDGRLRR